MTRDIANGKTAADATRAGAQEPLPEDVALEIDRVSHNELLAGPAGAAMRSTLIGIAIVGGAVWLARFLLGKARIRDPKDKSR